MDCGGEDIFSRKDIKPMGGNCRMLDLEIIIRVNFSPNNQDYFKNGITA